jgi:hypothetical protein
MYEELDEIKQKMHQLATAKPEKLSKTKDDKPKRPVAESVRRR